MVFINRAIGEIQCKIVYFGPGLSGKTTNLEVVHEKAPEDAKGELTSIATESDRTLFFDFMPLNLGTVGGMKTKFQLYTVPGQVYYNSTRKLVLRGADGVIFVADSTPEKMAENLESLDNLEECLREQGKELKDFAHVIQFNKRDMPGALPIAEMERQLNRYGAPCFEAVAYKGDGVIETFKGLSSLVIAKVKGMAERPAPRPAPVGAAASDAGGRASGMRVQGNAPPMPERKPEAGTTATADPPRRTGAAPPTRSAEDAARAVTSGAKVGPSARPAATPSRTPMRPGTGNAPSPGSQRVVVGGARVGRRAGLPGGAFLWILITAAVAGGVAFVMLGN